MIEYSYSAETVTPNQLTGFFVGWPNPPSPETHLKILKAAYAIVLARDSETARIVGFVNAISDGILTAYLPLLEVLPEYQKRGIGSELLTRIIEKMDGFYVIDLMCDVPLQPYYERFGMVKATGMALRNFDNQSGREAID